ncbi:hypothetical protein ACS8FD_02435 [Psychrobacter sp. 1U2]|uniref:hypothetical protein n=1 Tax=Psychrobacter sp. 1U2 TaxID=3453577 RepID=UPI003F464C26
MMIVQTAFITVLIVTTPIVIRRFIAKDSIADGAFSTRKLWEIHKNGVFWF